jgi:hypothetical protein
MAFAQQAPIMPRVSSGAIIYLDKKATPRQQIEAKSLFAGIFKCTTYSGRLFTVTGVEEKNEKGEVKPNKAIIVESADVRGAQFALGSASSSSGTSTNSSNSSVPVTPAFVLQGLHNQLMAGFNLGSKAAVNETTGSTLLSPGSSTLGINLLWYGNLSRTKHSWKLANGDEAEELSKSDLLTKDIESKTLSDGKTKLGDLLGDATSGIKVRITTNTGQTSIYARAGVGLYGFTDTKSGQAADGEVAHLTLGLQRVYEGFSIGDADIQVGVQVGVTSRFIMGDVLSSNNAGMSESLFGSKRSGFVGLEGALFAKAGDVVPYVRATYFGNGKLNGFSGWQVVVGADLFPKLFSSK